MRALNPLVLQPGGGPPRTADEVVIDKHSAAVGHLKVGDRVEVLSQLPPSKYVITGIVKWGSADSPLGASITAFDARLPQPGCSASRARSTPGRGRGRPRA